MKWSSVLPSPVRSYLRRDTHNPPLSASQESSPSASPAVALAAALQPLRASESPVHTGTSPLLRPALGPRTELPRRHGRSRVHREEDRLPPPVARQLQLTPPDTSVTRRTAGNIDRPREPEAGPQAADGAAASDAASTEALRRQLAEGLRNWPFSDKALRDLDAQEELEASYLERAVRIVQKRKEAFGGAQYRVGEDMATQTRASLLPVMVQGFQAFVSSAFRSPSGSATSLSLVSNDAFYLVDHALTTASVQGTMAYMAEGVLDAMSRRGRLHNLGELVNNRFEDLLYEQGVRPGTVLLKVTDGRKEYVRAGDPGAPVPARLAQQAAERMATIKTYQQSLDGKGTLGFLANPLLSGGLNALRRRLSSNAVLEHPVPLFLTSALASGAASGIAKIGLNLGKSRAQVTIPDLMGGQQKVNLFRLERPVPDAQPAQWGDVRGLPRFLGETARESWDIAGAAVRTPFSSAWDMLSGYALSNAVANIGGLGAGLLGAQIMRPGRALGPVPGESPRSRAAVFQQLLQSIFGDALWRGMTLVFRGRSMSAAEHLDHDRKGYLDEQLQEAERLRGELRDQAAKVPAGTGLWSAESLRDVDLETHGHLRQRLCGTARLDLPQLRTLQRQLQDMRPADADAGRQRELADNVQALIGALDGRERMTAWMQPRTTQANSLRQA